MNTNKAAYWIALGVMALGLNSEYRQGNFVALHRIAGSAESVACRVAARAEQTLALAKVLMSPERFAADNLVASKDNSETAQEQAEMVLEQARDEGELVRDRIRERVRDEVRAQADAIRADAEMRHSEMQQIRSRTRSQFRLARTADRRVMVVCPKTGTRIAINDGPESVDVSPDVEVGDSF